MDTNRTQFKVGVICGSTRSVRVGPQITAFVHDTIKSHLSSRPAKDYSMSLETVDLATFALPLFDEPVVPQAVTNPSGYTHPHTRAWSARVSSLDAFVFVTPQYNWGIPAGLKNAIDYLFNEWKGKPAIIVSYGGHGGGRAAAALTTVCQGLRMRVVEKTVGLSFPDKQFTETCFVGGDLGLAGEGSNIWVKEKQELVTIWEEMMKSLTPSA